MRDTPERDTEPRTDTVACAESEPHTLPTDDTAHHRRLRERDRAVTTDPPSITYSFWDEPSSDCSFWDEPSFGCGFWDEPRTNLVFDNIHIRPERGREEEKREADEPCVSPL